MPRHSLVAILFLATTALPAQPTLRITSPADRTLVNPGQSIKVTVEASGRFFAVSVIGWQPIRSGETRNAPPYDFTVEIPDTISPGEYTVTAAGSTGSRLPTLSDPIHLVVELADAPITLKVQPSVFEIYSGRQGHISAVGVFPDGLWVNLANSTETSFKSSAPTVVTVDHEGTVNPVTPGSAKITVTYRGSSIDIPVTVLPKRQ
jgi:hypothetical protein